MKITDIECIPIVMPLAERYNDHHGRVRMGNIDEHLVVKVHTDNGLVGYGDYEDDPNPIPQSIIDTLIGRSPFDFLHNNFNMALGMALYDVMGKHLGVPAYKLMGQKVRDAVSVAAWTRPCPPEVFRDEIQRAASQGYTIFKMHSGELWDVIEQTRLAAEVAPPGFKIHWDFNHNRSLAVVLPIINELEKNHPIVGYIEDPLPWTDIDGWKKLREKTRLPLIMHVPQLGGIQEVIQGCADIYMIGGEIGTTLMKGFAYGQANIQTLIQQSGGTLMKALTLHQAAVLPSATAHTINLDDQYSEDITTERIPVIEGFSPVPEAPGLGFEVDEDVIARFASGTPLTTGRILGILSLPGGHKFYTPRSLSVARLTGYEEGAIRGINFEKWEDDGSSEFNRIYERVEREGSFKVDN